MALLWKVVGGADKGGIIARGSADLGSPHLPSRLGFGAVVEEVTRLGDRLQFQKRSGDGPSEGWVTISLRDKVLLERLVEDDVADASGSLSKPQASVATEPSGTALESSTSLGDGRPGQILGGGELPDSFSISGVTLQVSKASSAALVPTVPPLRGLEVSMLQATPMELSIIRWIMQKVKLRQDMFLLGLPGPMMRHIVFEFCSMFRREVEYVGITRDTNESDLKQRREIRSGCVEYVDQPPVRAALRGRMLVLEGVEKAERNVLPLLNNLLENREMALEDNRFLLSPERAAKLQESGCIGLSEETRLVPVHPDFIVVALGLPPPGKPLDPPLRSRFSAKAIPPPSNEEWLGRLSLLCPSLPSRDLRRLVEVTSQLVQLGMDAASEPGKLGKTPAFPAGGLVSVAKLLHHFPSLSSFVALTRAFPLEVFPGLQKHATSIRKMLGGENKVDGYNLVGMIHSQDQCSASATAVKISFAPKSGASPRVEVPAAGGPLPMSAPALAESPFDMLASAGYSLTPGQRDCLSAMLMDHSIGMDICIASERGMGKSLLVHAFARMLGYQHRVVFCYHDLTARELLQRRTTDPQGNTEWHDSPLVQAATRGEIAVLDGVHRLAAGTIYATLGPLLADRAAILPDGSRLVAPSHWAVLASELGFCADACEHYQDGVLLRRVHPSFRCIATAELLSGAAGPAPWCDGELLTLFHIHVLPRLQAEDLLGMPDAKGTDEKVLKGIMAFANSIQKAAVEDASLEPLRLSVRTFLRLASHLRERPGDVQGALNRVFSACLRFLPLSAQEAVDSMLVSSMRQVGVTVKGMIKQQVTASSPAEANERRRELRELEARAIQARMMGGGAEVDAARERGEEERAEQKRQRMEKLSAKASAAAQKGCKQGATVIDGVLVIGDAACVVRAPTHPELVPDVAFVDIPGHIESLRDMLLDWSLGHNLLLVGNQGVGKNKLADRLLCLLRCEREYVQLHRDSTVQGLTMSPSLKDGVVTWVDSPVIRAVREGRCLVVDEADKAPSEVVCILKALCEDSELSLLDGRILVREGDSRLAQDAAQDSPPSQFLPVSKHFRMIVLANRPGFPFLGNDFFRVCGDVFSCHTIDNPDIESEVALLRSVGPSVSKDRIVQLSLLFTELRDLVEAGQLAYPYSTRELVKVVAHLQHFPDDMVEEALASVFAFDLSDTYRRPHLLEVFQRHGMAASKHSQQVLLGRAHGDMSLKLDPNRDKSKDVTNPDNKDGSKPPDMAPGGPKHGKWDGGQHVGGNQFAGGSGGTGTAGLGGRWGPYRLDVGQKLVMVSEESKKGIDEETKRQAEKMADEAHAKRLQEIRGSLGESKEYAALKEGVALQIREMKVVLEGHEARAKERQWLRMQTHGELDDSRLVDGITGSKNIYLRRGEPDANSLGAVQKDPKRITFVMDISGSMYTFNRIDRRLQRLQETAVFIFESFAGFEAKYDYRMVGHSGSGPEAESFVDWAKPPRTEKERLEICKRMEAHAQFCYPGDHTLEGTARAIDEIARKPADERFVLIVSDADLARYNIDVRQWGKILHKHASVKAYVILISNNVDEAERIKATLAPGRAHICAETTSLAVTFKQIFKDSVLRSDD